MSENDEKLVVYNRYSTPMEALIVNGLLSSANIYAEVINNDLSYAGFGTGIIGESQAGLLVRKEDVEKIDELLAAKFKQNELTDEFK